MEVTAREPVLVDLALQGGGSYGAFTRGVLDRLIEEPRLRIDAISGKSAGAMNAALVADGWTQKRTHRLLPLLHSAERVSASPFARRKAKGMRHFAACASRHAYRGRCGLRNDHATRYERAFDSTGSVLPLPL